jgi:hypothetical protein
MSEKVMPVTTTENQGYAPKLECPGCGGTYLHQCGVNVFNRSGEDSTEGIRATVDSDVTISSDVSKAAGNPSNRRGGLVIKFDCERCSDHGRVDYELVIEQHKGNEFTYWRPPESEN